MDKDKPEVEEIEEDPFTMPADYVYPEKTQEELEYYANEYHKAN